MRAALAEARKGLGRTHPNPAVGAVIVVENRIIAKGWHHGAGLPHAEIEALRSLKQPARNATIYVTLEPCSTHGRTPPCCAAIVQAACVGSFTAQPIPIPNMPGVQINSCKVRAFR